MSSQVLCQLFVGFQVGFFGYAIQGAAVIFSRLTQLEQVFFVVDNPYPVKGDLPFLYERVVVLVD